MKLQTVAFFLLVIFGTQALPQTVERPFVLYGHKYNFGKPAPVYTLFDEHGRSIVLAEDGEMRWFNDPTKPPVRTARIKEVPAFDAGPELKKEAADLIKGHQAIFGDIPENFFRGVGLIDRPGGKEFCLTDGDSKFYFYSIETGELLRKVMIQMPKHKYPNRVIALSDDNKIVVTADIQLWKTDVYSMETGKLLFEIDSPFLDNSALSPDGLTLFHSHNNLLSRYSTKTGKKSAADITIDSYSIGFIKVSQTGDKIAFTLYTKGNYDGQAIMNVETGKFIKGDPTLKHFGVLAFTPDGKLLTVANDRGYMHFIDTATGLHAFSYIATFNDLWVNAGGVIFSPDSTKMSFAAGEYDMPYYIYVDLTQRRITRVGKLEP